MPFITLAEFKSTVLPGADEIFFSSGEAGFIAIEKDAAQIILEETGVAVPADAADAPVWVKLPAAWLIYYIALTRNSGIKQEEMERGERLYDKAMELLAKHREKSSPAGTFKTAAIEGLEAW